MADKPIFTKPIPFVNVQESGYEELSGATPLAMNIIVDGKGCVKRRPGIKAYSGAPSTVIDANGLVGIHATRNMKLLVVGAAGAERPIYSLTAGGATAIGGGIPPNGLRGASRPVFAETEMLLVIAGGDEMQKIELATLASSRLAATAPKASHVIANHLRLLANDVAIDQAAVRFSDIAGGETSFAGHLVWAYSGFGTSGYFTAEGKPDDVMALMENTNEVFVPGTGTIQVFQPDAQVTYAPVGTTEIGMVAPYSVIKLDMNFAWMDQLKRFILSDGRSYKDISAPIARTLDTIDVADDCFGYRVAIGELDALVWSFPQDGRTFVYQTGVGWGQWSGWTDNWAPFKVQCCKTMPAWFPDGTNHAKAAVVVGTSDGFVGEFDFDTPTDLGTEIKAYVRTGFQDRGTQKMKHCRSVAVTMRRSASGPPVRLGDIRFADSVGNWSDPIPLESGDREPVVILRSLGSYRTRQWEFSFTSTETLALVSVLEEFEVSDQ